MLLVEVHKYTHLPRPLFVYALPGLLSKTILHPVGSHDSNEYHSNVNGKNALQFPLSPIKREKLGEKMHYIEINYST